MRTVRWIKKKAMLSGAAIALAIAGVSPALAREKVTLWFWGTPPSLRDLLQKELVKPFEASQSRYSLEIQYRNTVDNDVRIALMAGGGPDIVYTSGPSYLAPLERVHRVISLDDYDRKYGWSDRLQPDVLNLCRRDGHLVCLPPTVETDGMLVNQRVLRAHGWPVPRDVKTLVAVMQAAQAAGLYASVVGNKGWQPVNENFASIFLNGMIQPAEFRSILTGKRSWSGPDTLAAIRLSRNWFNAGFFGGKNYFTLNFDQSIQMLHDGRSAFMFGTLRTLQWAPTYFATPEEQKDLLFLPFPRMRASIPYPMWDVALTTTLSINANSKVKDGAAAVLDMIMSPSFMKRITPGWPGYWSIPLKKLPEMPQTTGLARTFIDVDRQINAAITDGRFGYKLQTFAPLATQQVFIQDLESVWVGLETPEQMLQKADEQFAREQKKGLVPSLPPVRQ